MLSDDYFVIVYCVLTYLYECVKKGRRPEWEDVRGNSGIVPIHMKYWSYIVWSIERAEFAETLEGKAQITPKGIEYLFEDKMMRRADDFLVKTSDAYIP